MASKTVVIQCDEQGQYAVGEEPDNEDQASASEADEQNALDPVGSLDEALAKAKELFTATDESKQSAQEGDAAFQDGFKSVNAAGMGGGLGM